VSQNYKEAADWFTGAANQGHVEAKRNLSIMYLKGLGVPQDFNKAMELISEAN